jgi:hypothetical protein
MGFSPPLRGGACNFAARRAATAFFFFLRRRMFRSAPAGRQGLFSYFTFAASPAAGPSFRASEKKQKVA